MNDRKKNDLSTIFLSCCHQTPKPGPTSTAASARDNNEKLSDAAWLNSYIAWIRLSKMIERNSAMIDYGKRQIFKATSDVSESGTGTMAKKVTKAADIVRMYDLLLQVSQSSIESK